MKKIMFYISSLSRGGAERVVMTLANYLSADAEILVLTDTKDANEYGEATKFQRIDLGFVPYHGIVGKITGRLAYLRKIRTACRQCAPDVIVSFSESGGNRIATATMGLPYKKVTAIRSNPANSYKTTKEKNRINRQLAGNDGIVFQTEEQKLFFADMIQQKSTIILNPIGEKFTKTIPVHERQKEVVTAGRLSKSKDHAMLIKAFALLAPKYPDYTFKIYGGGELEQQLREQIQSLHMESRILLMGETAGVEAYIKKAAVFVLSSTNEGLPNALMEAMAMGMPVVSTDCPCGGPRTLIQNERNGLLVPVGDETAMAAAISKLLDDETFAEELARNAKQLTDRCSEQKIAHEWLAFLNKITEL